MAGNHGRAHGRISSHGRGSRGHRGRGHLPPSNHRGGQGGGQGLGRGRGVQHQTASLESAHTPPRPGGAAGNDRGRGHALEEQGGAGAAGGMANAPGRSTPGGGRGAGRSTSNDTKDDSLGHGLEDQQGNQKKKRKDPSVKRECTICTEEHFTNQCPLLRGPKPTVAYCGAAEDGLGFFQIQAARNSQIVMAAQSLAAALITVEAGEVSANLLRFELARIIPVRWDWEVQDHGANSYVVPFPSTAELERMVAIRTITTKNKEGTIIIEEFIDDVQPIKILEQIWVTVTRVPRVLRSFLPLWAVGSIVGATQKVDMAHLRATGQVRILVAVLDSKKIPKKADVCANSSVYRLYFKWYRWRPMIQRMTIC